MEHTRLNILQSASGCKPGLLFLFIQCLQSLLTIMAVFLFAGVAKICGQFLNAPGGTRNHDTYDPGV